MKLLLLLVVCIIGAGVAEQYGLQSIANAAFLASIVLAVASIIVGLVKYLDTPKKLKR